MGRRNRTKFGHWCRHISMHHTIYISLSLGTNNSNKHNFGGQWIIYLFCQWGHSKYRTCQIMLVGCRILHASVCLVGGICWFQLVGQWQVSEYSSLERLFKDVSHILYYWFTLFSSVLNCWPSFTFSSASFTCPWNRMTYQVKRYQVKNVKGINGVQVQKGPIPWDDKIEYKQPLIYSHSLLSLGVT